MSASISHVQYLGLAEWLVYPFFASIFSKVQWAAYALVIPAKRHHPVYKQTGHTAYIEKLNCTLRQRVGRLVRKTPSFSKKLENHIGAIFFFAHHYNSSLSI